MVNKVRFLSPCRRIYENINLPAEAGFFYCSNDLFTLKKQATFYIWGASSQLFNNSTTGTKISTVLIQVPFDCQAD